MVMESAETGLKPCRTEQDYRLLLEDSRKGPVFLLKHSLTCGISTGAHAEFRRFCEVRPKRDCRLLVVQESRALSDLIAEETGIRHESPQALLFRSGGVVWSASHGGVTAGNLLSAFESAL